MLATPHKKYWRVQQSSDRAGDGGDARRPARVHVCKVEVTAAPTVLGSLQLGMWPPAALIMGVYALARLQADTRASPQTHFPVTIHLTPVCATHPCAPQLQACFRVLSMLRQQLPDPRLPDPRPDPRQGQSLTQFSQLRSKISWSDQALHVRLTDAISLYMLQDHTGYQGIAVVRSSGLVV